MLLKKQKKILEITTYRNDVFMHIEISHGLYILSFYHIQIYRGWYWDVCIGYDIDDCNVAPINCLCYLKMPHAIFGDDIYSDIIGDNVFTKVICILFIKCNDKVITSANSGSADRYCRILKVFFL